MSSVRLAMPTIFAHEGGYVNNKADPGGATNFGISLRFLLTAGDLDHDGWPDGDLNHDGKINAEDIARMNPTEAAKLYENHFWEPNGYGRINNQAIATKLFDLSVNMGSVGGHKCIQRAVRAASNYQLKDDGKLGELSISRINFADPYFLLSALKSESAGYYRSIVSAKPKMSVFINGWLNRAYSNPIL